MSSRAYKKLHGNNDLQLLNNRLAAKDGSENSEDDEEINAISRPQNKFSLAMVISYMYFMQDTCYNHFSGYLYDPPVQIL